MAKVLIADDELTMIQMVSDLIRKEGHEPITATSLEAALEIIESNPPDVVVTDLYLDKTRTHGFQILEKARAMSDPAVVIMITGFGSVETAVEAMKKGAYDYLEKPFKLDELRLCVERAIAYRRALSENIYLRKQLRAKYHFDQLVGVSPKIQTVFKLIERVADTDSTVLIHGESGTGKELVARALHFNSRRQQGKFVPVNCSALPESLLESELFGHRKGAFAGAICDKKGLFEEADGGTIFLDDVAALSPMLQTRLLRVLQEREVRRVGDNAPTYVNVRVIAATREPLDKRVKEGALREDLFYRLNVIQIGIPKLAERRDDIPVLVAHFLKNKISSRTGKPYQVTRQAMETLCGCSWPGNVRELENAIERACAVCETNIIQPTDLPSAVLGEGYRPQALSASAAGSANVDSLYQFSGSDVQHPLTSSIGANTSAPVQHLKIFVREQELTYLSRALAQTDGDKEKAAEILGISLATLYRKLAEHQEA